MDEFRPAPNDRLLADPAPLAAVCFTFAAIFLLDSGPLRSPDARDLATQVLAWAGFALMAAVSRAWKPTLVALACAAVAGVVAPDPSWPVLILALGARQFAARHGSAMRAASTGLTSVIIALVARTLARSFEPERVEDWIESALFGWIPPGAFPSECSPAVIALLALPIGFAALRSIGANAAVASFGVLGLLGAAVYGRWVESPWPLALSVGAVAALPGRTRSQGRGIRSPDRGRTKPTAWRSAVWIAFSVAISALALLSMGAATQRARQSPYVVGIVTAMHGTFDRPGAPPATEGDAPRFGQFRRLLGVLGATTVELSDPADVGTLACDAYITINFSGETAEAFVPGLRRRVESGARLLVLADHTDLFGQMAVTNRLLDRTGIVVQFDSTVPLSRSGGWVGAFLAARDPLFGPDPFGSGIPWGVGCSLAVTTPAIKLATATHAFLDKGVPAKIGGLDNLRRDAGERLGGFALAASSRLGRGDVLVFGDTSALQDASLASDFAFARRVGEWLLGGIDLRSRRVPGWWGAALGAILLSLALVVVVDHRAAVGMALCVGFVDFSSARSLSLVLARPIDDSAVAIVTDYGCGEFPRATESLDPLLRQMSALGHDPIAVRFDDALKMPAICIVNPLGRISRADTQRLLAAVRQGTTLIAFIGDRSRASAYEVLRELGLEIGVPLGWGVVSRWSGPLAEHEGVPRMRSSFEVFGPALLHAEPVATVFGRPVAVRGRLGEGQWLVVGDVDVMTAKHSDRRHGGSADGSATLYSLLSTVLLQRGTAR